jgi:DNA-directed RNA polymerase subunit N (RpoN/RPB10)
MSARDLLKALTKMSNEFDNKCGIVVAELWNAMSALYSEKYNPANGWEDEMHEFCYKQMRIAYLAIEDRNFPWERNVTNG